MLRRTLLCRRQGRQLMTKLTLLKLCRSSYSSQVRSRSRAHGFANGLTRELLNEQCRALKHVGAIS